MVLEDIPLHSACEIQFQYLLSLGEVVSSVPAVQNGAPPVLPLLQLKDTE